MTRTYSPETPIEKLKAANELLADVAQVLIGLDSPEAAAAARKLMNDLADIRVAAQVLQAAA